MVAFGEQQVVEERERERGREGRGCDKRSELLSVAPLSMWELTMVYGIAGKSKTTLPVRPNGLALDSSGGQTTGGDCGPRTRCQQLQMRRSYPGLRRTTDGGKTYSTLPRWVFVQIDQFAHFAVIALGHVRYSTA